MENVLINTLKDKTSSVIKCASVICLSVSFGIAFVRLSLFHFACFLASLISPFLFSQPYIFLLLLTGILVLFPNVGFGVREGVTVFNIYSKGSGVLPIPLFSVGLFCLFLSVYIKITSTRIRYGSKLIFLDWSIILLLFFSVIYILVAFLANPKGVSMDGFRRAVSQYGVIGYAQFGIMYFIVKLIISEKGRLLQLNRLIFTLALGRAAYGIIRFLFFGGDPANFYANYEGRQVKLTFFDIYDSAFFMYIFSFCFINILKLLNQKKHLIFTILLSGINIVFSFRRTVWIGFIFALIYLSFNLEKGKRIFVYGLLLLIFVISIPIASSRFDSQHSIFSDLSLDYSTSKGMGRFGELFYAIKTIAKSPLYGLGATGHYDAPTVFQWRVSTEIVHSTMVHIALKMGILGLILFFLIVIGVYSLRSWNRESTLHDRDCAVIFYSAYSTLIFLLPDIFFAPSLIELRHSVSLGLFVGLVSVSARFLGQEHKLRVV
ncbi:MAG: hypothetical protein B6D35_14010 [Candidatus Brocadia sp. UTAMX2]|jgi:hypothetical protein|nr:MAG: hypothetical protein B6D35_14010 [Candidatus Brocadia sp. UTAMX2]